MNLAELARFWDERTAEFLDGQEDVPAPLRRWFSAYQGSGHGAVVLAAFCEPYLGVLDRRPRGVFLALNPGRAVLEFQGPKGIFADEMRVLGGYSRWAETWPYLRTPWTSTIGRNAHHSDRLTFLQRWFAESPVTSVDMVGFELYPWHSTKKVNFIRPDPGVFREFVWEPIEALGAPVFAFGSDIVDALERFGLTKRDHLGSGGRAFESTRRPTSYTQVRLYESPGGQLVLAESHSGHAGPPSLAELQAWRRALGI